MKEQCADIGETLRQEKVAWDEIKASLVKEVRLGEEAYMMVVKMAQIFTDDIKNTLNFSS